MASWCVRVHRLKKSHREAELVRWIAPPMPSEVTSMCAFPPYSGKAEEHHNRHRLVTFFVFAVKHVLRRRSVTFGGTAASRRRHCLHQDTSSDSLSEQLLWKVRTSSVSFGISRKGLNGRINVCVSEWMWTGETHRSYITARPEPQRRDIFMEASLTQHHTLFQCTTVQKRSFKEKYWGMGLFISFNLFCHIFVRPDK